MGLEKKVKQNLLGRGFTEEQLLNNRGLIGAAIDETALILVKKLTIPVVSNNEAESEVAVCGCTKPDSKDKDHNTWCSKCFKVYHIAN